MVMMIKGKCTMYMYYFDLHVHVHFDLHVHVYTFIKFNDSALHSNHLTILMYPQLMYLYLLTLPLDPLLIPFSCCLYMYT